MEKITEEMHLEKEWFLDARKQTVETLPTFVNHVMNDYEHDYGTVCHAVAACAIAAMSAADDTPNGGITGFQAGFVMWDFVRQVCYSSNKCGLRILDYDNLLYPQYKYKFEKNISSDTWKSLREQAKKNLDDIEWKRAVHPDVVDHWESIVEGVVPFGYTVKDN